MKKIAILGPAYPLRGGIAALNERLAQAFIDEEVEVKIYTFSLQYPSFLFPGKTQFSESAAPDNLNIEICVNSVNPFNWFKVGRKIRKTNPDLMIVRYWIPFMAPCLGTISKIVGKKTKVVALVDNAIPHEAHFTDKILTRYFVKRVHAFLAMSQQVVRDIQGFDKKKPKAFSPHPLYDHFGDKVARKEALQALQLSEEDRHVLFFGLIRDYKGLDLLLKAFADERLRERKIKLLVAGEFYANEEKYRALIKELDLEDRLHLDARFVPDEEVGNFFGAADLVAQPYKSATQSGVTQIGYHFEKPMLVTNVGGLAEIIPNEKVGYVVEPGPTEIADKILDFFDNKRSEEFTQNLLKEKKKYEWAKMTATIRDLAEETR